MPIARADDAPADHLRHVGCRSSRSTIHASYTFIATAPTRTDSTFDETSSVVGCAMLVHSESRAYRARPLAFGAIAFPHRLLTPRSVAPQQAGARPMAGLRKRDGDRWIVGRPRGFASAGHPRVRQACSLSISLLGATRQYLYTR
jgi:hypothetical protein